MINAGQWDFPETWLCPCTFLLLACGSLHYSLAPAIKGVQSKEQVKLKPIQYSAENHKILKLKVISNVIFSNSHPVLESSLAYP